MKTVKEFRDLGVEYVDGDVCREIFNKHWWKSATSTFDGEVVTYFAWRPLNTLPDNPKFLCDINYGDHSWRPSLDQSGSKAGEQTKPVFTQAMADAGELPPVGSRCLAVYKMGVKNYEVEVTVAHINGNQVACIDANNDYLIQYTDSAEYFKPIDTRTPKQKTVDKIVKMLHSEGVVAFDPIMLHIMYEKGFIK